jgi:hypothetical protein
MGRWAQAKRRGGGPAVAQPGVIANLVPYDNSGELAATYQLEGDGDSVDYEVQRWVTGAWQADTSGNTGDVGGDIFTSSAYIEGDYLQIRARAVASGIAGEWSAYEVLGTPP